MSYLEVVGGNKNQRILAEKAATFAINYLFPKIRKYDILIQLGNNTTDCFEHDDREYEININRNVDHDDFITAIFHELVHVKQYIIGTMKDYTYNSWDEYINHPCEIEAYETQEVMLNKWSTMKTQTQNSTEDKLYN